LRIAYLIECHLDLDTRRSINDDILGNNRHTGNLTLVARNNASQASGAKDEKCH